MDEPISPAELAKRFGWSERRVRSLAREIGACRVLGNRMMLLPEDVDAILEATRPKPLGRAETVGDAFSNTNARIPNFGGYAELLRMREKAQKKLAEERAAKAKRKRGRMKIVKLRSQPPEDETAG